MTLYDPWVDVMWKMCSKNNTLDFKKIVWGIVFFYQNKTESILPFSDVFLLKLLFLLWRIKGGISLLILGLFAYSDTPTNFHTTPTEKKGAEKKEREKRIEDKFQIQNKTNKLLFSQIHIIFIFVARTIVRLLSCWNALLTVVVKKNSSVLRWEGLAWIRWNIKALSFSLSLSFILINNLIQWIQYSKYLEKGNSSGEGKVVAIESERQRERGRQKVQ